MKVKLGPDFLESWHNCFGPWGRFKTWIYENNPYRNLRTILQRGTRGYSKKEYWNLNSWVGKVILNNLKHFKEEKRMGYPATFKDCYEWEKKLDKMIAGWEVLVEWDEIFECIDKRYQRESKGKTKKFYGLKIKELTKEERKAFNEETEKLYNKAVKNAKLLPEFFMSLWD